MPDPDSRIHNHPSRKPCLASPFFFCMLSFYFQGSCFYKYGVERRQALILEAALVTQVTPRVIPNPRVRFVKCFLFLTFQRRSPVTISIYILLYILVDGLRWKNVLLLKNVGETDFTDLVRCSGWSMALTPILLLIFMKLR